jgi:predicted Rossmann fold nucleotide-binding protein DprA/Smf involved in DNA uptake
VGPNTLLRLGARPLLTARDVFDAIGHDPPDQTPRQEGGHPILDHLPGGTRATTDELVSRSGLAVTEVHTVLLNLELAGIVERLSDGSFQQRRARLPEE